MPIEVRYNPAFGILMVALAAFTVVAGLVTGKLMLLAIGGLNIVVGLGFATRPMFVVHEGRVELKNLFGMTMKTVDVPLDQLELRDGKLYRRGQSKPVAGSMMSRKDDMDRVAAALRG